MILVHIYPPLCNPGGSPNGSRVYHRLGFRWINFKVININLPPSNC